MYPLSQRWDRETNEWEPIFTPINSICGGWAKLPNGNVGMFAGHYQTLWVRGPHQRMPHRVGRRKHHVSRNGWPPCCTVR